MSGPIEIPAEGLYIGEVFHERHRPFTHKLKYRVFTLFMDLDNLEALSRRSRFFSYNAWNMLGFSDLDHGPRTGSSIRQWLEYAGLQKGIDLSGARIFVLCFPRLWGYVFAPLTLYYCFEAGKLTAVIYQVKNTFGEQHSYFIPVSANQGMIRQEVPKIFHVSPFIEMDCQYKFRLTVPGEHLNVAIHQFTGEGKILTATWTGEYRPLTDKEMLKAVLRHPLMTFKVIAGIHWEAFHLWRKGAKYIKKPEPPDQDISVY